MPRWLLGGLAFAGCLLSLSSVLAQELRVYTLTRDQASSQVVSRNLTVFHAGKVYDYIESLREVTIYDPAHRRFFVIQENLGAFAEVSQDEVRRFLGLAEEQVRVRAGDLVRQPDPAAPDAVELLQLQIQPKFTVRYEESAKRLRLESPRFLYEVACTTPPQPAVLDAYLKYADAIAELNSVLHPQSLLPAPRWQLNRELRERNVLPVSVRRRLEFGMVSDLKAEHEWTWSLKEHDRKLISHWESQLSSKVLRPVPFKQLQQSVLGGLVQNR